jgi:hypothetical protein
VCCGYGRLWTWPIVLNGCNALGMLRESEYGGGAFWSSLCCVVLELAARGDQNTCYNFFQTKYYLFSKGSFGDVSEE